MAPLKGLSGLYADPQDTTDYFDEGVLEAKANAPDSDHSDYGSQSNGYSGTVPTESPFGGQQVYDGWDAADAEEFGGRGFRVAGTAIEQTPETHSSPYPRGIIQPSWENPDAWADVGEQIASLHSQDLGGPKFYNGNAPAGHEEPTDYTTNRYDAPNENYLADTPGQIRGTGFDAGRGGYGGGNADTTQGYGVLNSLPEFQMGHSIRREQHDSAVFDYTNTHGEQHVPFMGRHPVEQMPLDGPDSPYFDNGSIDGANVVWEGRIGDPTVYTQPPEPTTLPANSGYSPDVFAWG